MNALLDSFFLQLFGLNVWGSMFLCFYLDSQVLSVQRIVAETNGKSCGFFNPNFRRLESCC